LLHEATNSSEDIFLVDTELPRLLQVVRKYVQEQFRVGRSVDVAVGGCVHVLQQRSRIYQIAILQYG